MFVVGAVGRLHQVNKLDFHFACKPSSLLASPRKNLTLKSCRHFFPASSLLTKTATTCMRGRQEIQSERTSLPPNKVPVLNYCLLYLFGGCDCQGER